MANIFIQFWRWLLGLFWTKKLKLVLVGLPNAGKTTLVHAFQGIDTESDTVPTVGSETTVTKTGNVEFNICDFSGAPAYKFLWEPLCTTANVIIFVVDSSKTEDVDASETELTELLKKPDLQEKPILVIANKQDLPEALSKDDILARLRLAEAGEHVHLFLTSAKKKTNVDQVVNWMIDNL